MTNVFRNVKCTALLASLAMSSAPGYATEFTPERICKAGIAAIMGRNPTSMRVTSNKSGVVSLYYIREDDGKKWSYKCRPEGQRIVWAADPGRWRNDPADEVIEYRNAGDSIEIVQKFGDGSSSNEKFSGDSLK